MPRATALGARSWTQPRRTDWATTRCNDRVNSAQRAENGTDNASGRATTTMSSPWGIPTPQIAARSRRFARLRWTAPPTLRPATTAMRGGSAWAQSLCRACTTIDGPWPRTPSENTARMACDDRRRTGGTGSTGAGGTARTGSTAFTSAPVTGGTPAKATSARKRLSTRTAASVPSTDGGE